MEGVGSSGCRDCCYQMVAMVETVVLEGGGDGGASIGDDGDNGGYCGGDDDSHIICMIFPMIPYNLLLGFYAFPMNMEKILLEQPLSHKQRLGTNYTSFISPTFI